MYILIAVSVLLNLISLVLLYLVFKRDQVLNDRVSADLTRVEINQKDIETIQNNFRRTLEETISKDSVLIESTTKSIIKYYQDTVGSLTQNYNLNSQKLAGVLNENLKKNLDTLANSIASQGSEVKKVFAVEVEKNLKETDKRLEEYEKKRMKAIDAQIYQIAEEAAKNIVARSLNLTEHQELVRAALEKAKEDKFFQ